MRKIYGYVLERESNLGITNLVVTAFDSDKSMKEIKAGIRNREEFSVEGLGKRIGSVLTDEAGMFVLSKENLEFEGNESRPNLLLAIFAPEDVQDANRIYPKAPEERLLYISTVPREDAGSEEAFLIRILRKQLEQFSIRSSTESNKATASNITNEIERVQSLRLTISERLGSHHKKEAARNEKIRNVAKGKLKGFSAIHPRLRSDPLLAENFQALAESKKKEIRIAPLKNYKGTIRLRLSKDELKKIGLSETKARNSKETIKTSSFTELMRAKLGGVDLIRRNDVMPSQTSAEYLYRKYVYVQAEDPIKPEPDGNTEKADRGRKRKSPVAGRNLSRHSPPNVRKKFK